MGGYHGDEVAPHGVHEIAFTGATDPATIPANNVQNGDHWRKTTGEWYYRSGGAWVPSKLAFADLLSTPTTIAGYGITDFDSLGDARWAALSHTHSFASLTAKPTTLAGYGITDAATNVPQFVTLAASADLTNERVLTLAARLSGTDGGAGGAYTIDLANNVRDAIAVAMLGDGSGALSTGVYSAGCYLPPGTIISAGLYSTKGETGSFSAELWADDIGNVVNSSDKITASDPIVASSALFGKNTTLTGWTTATAGGGGEGKMCLVNLSTVSTFTQLLLIVRIRRS